MTRLLMRLFVKNSENITDIKVRQTFGMLGGAVGICCNIFLFIVKFTAGILTGAISITADAFNNLSDAGSSVVTLIGFKMAGKPADRDHPFGHGRIEYLSGHMVSLAIMLMGVELVKTSFNKMLHPVMVEFHYVSVLILILSIALKLWMAAFNTKIGNKIGSAAMKATAKDSLSDCIATTGVLIGLFVGELTGLKIDGYVGMFVAVFILVVGVNAAKDTLQPLLGQAPDPDFVKDIEKCVMEHNEVVGIHDMIVHDYGPGRIMVSLHAEIPCDMDILKAHDVIDVVEYELKDRFNCEVTIHMDPIVTEDELSNSMKETVKSIVRHIDKEMNIHDFRMTQGPYHMNLIFDVMVPYNTQFSDELVKKRIIKEIKALNKNYYAVISIDKGYV